MDAREDLEERRELSCGRSYDSHLFRERGPFALPGDRTHWPRDRDFDLKHLRLEIALDPESRSLRGTASHTFAAINDGLKSVELDAVELRIGGVTSAQGVPLEHSHEDGKLRVVLDAALGSGQESTIHVAYSCTPRRGLYFNAPDDGYPDRPRQVWTQGEDEDSRFWFPCCDSPNQRFTSEVVVTVPREWNTVSNGRLAGVTENGPTKTYHWSQEPEHPTYLMSLVAGEYTEIREEWNGIPIVYYSPPGREEDTRRAFDKTPKMMRFFAEKIGTPYPWAKYSQVTAADFIFGGMENTSATTMTDALLHDQRAHLDFSTDSIVAHELAHQWWGDLLTCRDWSHAWLNEGFATYFDLLFKEHDLGVDEFRYGVYLDAQGYLEEDSRSYRRPIVSSVYNQPVDLFDRHLYEKGGLVLHMLRSVLGEALFWKAMAHYCRSRRGKSVTTEDLQRSIEESTGKNLDWFFHQWVYRGGHPELKVSYSWDEESGSAQVTVAQRQTTDDLTPLFRIPVDLVFVTSSGRQTKRVTISEAQQTFHFFPGEKPVMVAFDPGYWCLKTLEFERPREMMVYQLEHDEDVIGRVQAAQDLGKDGSPDSIRALKRAVLDDAFWGVQAQAARALGRTKSKAAMEALIECTGVAHPKARRAVAAALGEFKEQAAMKALEPLLESDASYFVEAEAARAIARTEQPGAFELVSAALGRPSVNEVVTVQAFAGLGALRDERAIPLAKEWAVYGRPQRAREAALDCLGKLGEGKRDVVDFLVDFVDDPWLRARLRAIGALQELKDDRAVPALSRRIQGELDGRVVRRCREAVVAIRRGRDRADDAKKLREDLEKLQEDNRKLKDRLDKLEAGTES